MSYKLRACVDTLFHTLFILTFIIHFNHLGKVFFVFCVAEASLQRGYGDRRFGKAWI